MIVDEHKDPNILYLEKKKKKKKMKTEGGIQAAQLVVDLEVDEVEIHPGSEMARSAPDIIPEEERTRVASGLGAREKETTPEVEVLAPHVRAYSKVLSGVREFLSRQDTSAQEALFANRPPRSSSYTPIRAEPPSSAALEIVPLSAVPFSSNPTEAEHLSTSDSEEENPVDVGQILRDLA